MPGLPTHLVQELNVGTVHHALSFNFCEPFISKVVGKMVLTSQRSKCSVS